MLTCAVFHDFEACVIAALPVQHQVQAVRFDRDDNLVEHGPQDPLAGLGGSSGVVPQPRYRSSASASKVRALHPRRKERPARSSRSLPDLVLDPRDHHETFISSDVYSSSPATSRLSRINRVILPARPSSFIARGCPERARAAVACSTSGSFARVPQSFGTLPREPSGEITRRTSADTAADASTRILPKAMHFFLVA